MIERKTREKPKTKRNKLPVMFALIVMFLVGFYVFKPASKVEASCTLPATTYGTDTISINVPATGTYTVWTRMESPLTGNNSIMLEVDGGGCYTVGGLSTMPVSQWTWVDYTGGNTNSPITLSNLSAGTHTLEYVGTQPGVSVDKALLLTDSSCVPGSDGNTGPTSGSNCTPLPLVSVPYYMQVGGPGYTNAQGIVWQADNYFTMDSTGQSSGGLSVGGDGTPCTTSQAYTNCTSHAIVDAANNDQKIYQYERWGNFHYNIPVANGNYDLVLKFAEINPATAREFNVSVEGTQVLTNYNITATVGAAYTADDVSVPVNVTGNNLNITLTSVENSAKLDGIEILPESGPTVSFSSPVSGGTVSGTAVNLAATATSTAGIQSIQYSLTNSTGGTPTIIGTPTTSPYSIPSWDSTSVANGTYTLTATATDKSGASASTSEQIIVSNTVIDHTPPSAPQQVIVIGKTSNQINLSWDPSTEQNGTVTGYHIYQVTSTGGNPVLVGTTQWTTWGVINLSPGTTYYFNVVAYDTPNNLTSTPSVPPTTGTTLPVVTTSTFMGTVTDKNGKLLKGVLVTSGSSGYKSTTNDAGQYQITGLPAGTMTFYYYKTGFNTGSQTVTIPADSVVNLNVSIKAN